MMFLLGQFKCHHDVDDGEDDDVDDNDDDEEDEDEDVKDLMLSPSLTRTFCCSVTNFGFCKTACSSGIPLISTEIKNL